MEQAKLFRPQNVMSLAALAAALMVFSGCDGERTDESAMVMQPTPSSQPATRPTTTPADEAAEDGTPVPVYISIDGDPYEFPPARLWLKRTGNRVRARLLSDDPPEALERDWSGDSFFFEMDMELPPGQTQGLRIAKATLHDQVATRIRDLIDRICLKSTSGRIDD